MTLTSCGATRMALSNYKIKHSSCARWRSLPSRRLPLDYLCDLTTGGGLLIHGHQASIMETLSHTTCQPYLRGLASGRCSRHHHSLWIRQSFQNTSRRCQGFPCSSRRIVLRTGTFATASTNYISYGIQGRMTLHRFRDLSISLRLGTRTRTRW